MLTPDGILLILALVIGAGYWLHKRRKPARDLSPRELEDYQG